jgi:hypothetical protein
MLRLPEFLDSRHMKVVRLSAVRSGLLYPRGDTELSNVFFLEQTTIRNRYYLNIEMEIWGIRSLGDACCKSYGLDRLIVTRM